MDRGRPPKTPRVLGHQSTPLLFVSGRDGLTDRACAFLHHPKLDSQEGFYYLNPPEDLTCTTTCINPVQLRMVVWQSFSLAECQKWFEIDLCQIFSLFSLSDHLFSYKQSRVTFSPPTTSPFGAAAGWNP